MPCDAFGRCMTCGHQITSSSGCTNPECPDSLVRYSIYQPVVIYGPTITNVPPDKEQDHAVSPDTKGRTP